MTDPNAKEAKKIQGLDDLKAIKDKVKGEVALRQDGYRACVTVHMGTCGISSGARDVMTAVMDELEATGAADIRVTTSGCMGPCAHEPVMSIETLDSEPVLYGDLDADNARLVFREHAVAGRPVRQFAVNLASATEKSESAGGEQ